MGKIDDATGFLSPRMIEKVHGLVERGFKTAQDVMDPDPQITVKRPPVGGGPGTLLGTYRVIMFQWGIRALEEDENGPLTMSTSDGTMRVQADGQYQPQINDVLTYAGRTGRVSAVYPPSFNVIMCEVELKQ